MAKRSRFTTKKRIWVCLLKNEKIMSYHTVVSTKKTAVGLVRFFRVHCPLAKFEEIPAQYRIATDRRYMVFVLNPGQADPAFAERCEKIIAKYNR